MTWIWEGKKARLLACISLFGPETGALNFKLSSTLNRNWAVISSCRYLSPALFVGGFYTSRTKETWKHTLLSQSTTPSIADVSH